MSTDLRAIMDRDQRRRRMLHDPDLTGEALLYALAFDEVLSTSKTRKRRVDHWAEAAILAWGDDNQHRLRRVITNDIPRFEPLRQGAVTPCVAPMIRREGLCGKRGTRLLVDRDPGTGEARWIGLCSRHRELETKFDARRREWAANGKPSPPPNAGGVLKRYFHTDWAQLYEWAAPWRTPLEGAREATPPRPTLRLIRSDERAASIGAES